MCPLWWDLRPA